MAGPTYNVSTPSTNSVPYGAGDYWSVPQLVYTQECVHCWCEDYDADWLKDPHARCCKCRTWMAKRFIPALKDG